MPYFRKSFVRAFAPIVLTVAVLAASAGTADAAFGDVEDDTFYADAVAWMAANEITTGIEPGCFGPGEPVTRGMVATFMYRLDRALGNDPATSDHPFDDIVFDFQNVPIGWLYDAGITTGTTKTTFSPESAVTRGDFATLLWRYAGEPSAREHPFEDVDRSYQQDAVAWMSKERITTGTSPTTFDPDAPMTRAEAATFMFRYVDPDVVPEIGQPADCTRTMRNALITGGLTRAEAACAAPWLTDFTVEYLTRVVYDIEPASFELILAVAIINDEGCVSRRRMGELSRIFL